MSYPALADFKELVHQITSYAQLQHERGAKSAGPIVSPVFSQRSRIAPSQPVTSTRAPSASKRSTISGDGCVLEARGALTIASLGSTARSNAKDDEVIEP